MNLKNIPLILLAVVVALASCEKLRPAELIVYSESVILDPAASVVRISVECNRKWDVSCDQSWVSCIGKLENSVMILGSPNNTGEARDATLTFSCEDKSVSIPVYQPQKIIELVNGEDDTVWVEVDQWRFTVKIKSNVKVKAVVGHSWIKLESSSSQADGVSAFTFTRQRYYDYVNGQEGRIWIKEDVLEGGMVLGVRVMIDPWPYVLCLNGGSGDVFDRSGGDMELRFASNREVKSIRLDPEEDWLTLEKVEKDFSVKRKYYYTCFVHAKPNDTGEGRQSVLKLDADEASATFEIYQSQYYFGE